MANKQVFVCNGIFHLYISVLKAINNKNKGIKSNLICFNLDWAFDPYIANIRKCEYFDDIMILPDLHNREIKGLLSLLKNIFFYRKEVIHYFNKNLDYQELKGLIKDAEINIFSTTLLFYKYLILCFPNNYFRVLEDGLIAYRRINNPISRGIKFLHGVPDCPSDPIFKEIWVQNPEKLPKRIRNKAKKMDLQQLVNRLTHSEKQEIMEFFLEGFEINDANTKKLLIVTQPLSEDGFVTENYKLQLYKKISNEYHKKGYRVYLKTHPREKTDYSAILPEGSRIIPGTFPLEILNLKPLIEFETGITIFSSALENSGFIKNKIFLGEEWDDQIYRELQKRFKMKKLKS